MMYSDTPNQYTLDPTEEYVINIDDEIAYQSAVMMAVRTVGGPVAIKDYYEWLLANGFDQRKPNPTNEFVAPYYGVKPLWSTDYSQGIVVKAEDDPDYFIVLECSDKNIGYKHTKIILTLHGCL